jgi:ABC-2 type transport system ATP-binding protein
MTARINPHGQPAISVHGLRKRFGRTDVLDGIDLEVPRNSVFGFLGPNGAGKSTTMKILVGLLRPTGGSADVCGHDIVRDSVAVRASIGYLPQDASYWRHLTVRGVLAFTARRYLSGTRTDLGRHVDDTIEQAGLNSLADRRVAKLSGGERQRLGVAQAWVGRPEVLILDEPSAGLDPEGRHEILDLLDRLRAEATIFFSTHILEDVERLSDMIAVLDKGRVVAAGPMDTFLVGDTGQYSLTLSGSSDRVLAALADTPWVEAVVPTAATAWDITVNDRPTAEHLLLRNIVRHSEAQVVDFRPARRSLEEIYLELTEATDAGQALDDRESADVE